MLHAKLLRQIAMGLVALGLIISFAFSSAAPAQAQGTPYAVVTGAALNIRSGPGTGYSVVRVAYQGQSLTLLGRNDSATWAKVRTAGTPTEGWVNASLIAPSVSIASLPLVNVPTQDKTALVNTGSANVRSGDTLQHPVVTTVGRLERVALLGRNDAATWAKIRTNAGHIGWINASLLSPENTTIAALPVAVVPLAPAPAEPMGNTAIVTSGSLNVRHGPGIAYARITSVTRGQSVTLIKRTADLSWALIRLSNGQEGWVNASYLRYNTNLAGLPVASGVPLPPATQPSAPPQPSAAATAYVHVALNVRTGPSTDYYATAIVFPGEYVALLGRSYDGAWAKVRLNNGHIGWITTYYISPSIYLSSLPVVN